MELEDAILSTLKEIEDKGKSKLLQPKKKQQTQEKKEHVETLDMQEKKYRDEDSYLDEKAYLSSMRERLLVLFEGFQAPNNSSIEAKIDLTLNYLEYVLASIDTRLDRLK
jgi:hypothetical protein